MLHSKQPSGQQTGDRENLLGEFLERPGSALDSCLRFEPAVTGALARLGSHLPATALVIEDLSAAHLRVGAQLNLEIGPASS